MSQNPFIEFRDDFPNSKPQYIIGDTTYKRLNYELQKCYEQLPMTVEPIVPYDELEERGIPYSNEGSYQIKPEYEDLFQEAVQELGLINLEEQTLQQEQYPQMVPPYLNEVVSDAQKTNEGGKRRSRKSKKSKRKSRKSKKSRKSRRKYRKH
jgi:hypothetical protein